MMSGKIRILSVILLGCLTTFYSTSSRTHPTQSQEQSTVLNERDLSDLVRWDSTLYYRNTVLRGKVKLRRRSIRLSFNISTKKPSQKLNFSLKKEASIPMVLEQVDVTHICSQSLPTHPLALYCQLPRR